MINLRVVTIGLLDASLVHPREVFAGPLSDRVASVIVAHNHPSGITEPSKEDIETAKQLMAAGAVLDIPIQEHLVLTADNSFSFIE